MTPDERAEAILLGLSQPADTNDIAFVAYAIRQARNEALTEIRIVFDGPPSHESGRFVEIEDTEGRSINMGEWHDRGDGFWELRLKSEPPKTE